MAEQDIDELGAKTLMLGDGATTKDQKPEHSIKYKILKTVVVVLIFVCMGLWCEANGSALQELMIRNNVDYEMISRAMSLQGVGGLISSVLGGGFLVEKFYHNLELMMAICLVLCAGLNLAVPYSSHIGLLFTIYFCQGLIQSIFVIGRYLILFVVDHIVPGISLISPFVLGTQGKLMEIWRDKASGPLHLLHLGYGAGGFIAPQIVGAFLSKNVHNADQPRAHDRCSNATKEIHVNGDIPQTTNSSLVLSSLASSIETTTAQANHSGSGSFQFAFVIISTLVLLVSGFWFAYFCYDKKHPTTSSQKKKVTFRGMFDLSGCSMGRPVYAFFIHVLVFFWVYLGVMGERTFSRYIYSYALDVLCFDKNKATTILTAFWISFTLGRFAGFVITNFIHMKYIIPIEGITNIVCALVLYFFNSNEYVLWAFVCLSGAFIGPCIPSGFAWINRYIEVTPTAIALVGSAGGFCDLSYLFLIGYLIKIQGVGVMMYFALGYGVCVCLLSILMSILTCKERDRFHKSAEEKPELEMNDLKA